MLCWKVPDGKSSFFQMEDGLGYSACPEGGLMLSAFSEPQSSCALAWEGPPCPLLPPLLSSGGFKEIVKILCVCVFRGQMQGTSSLLPPC